MALPRTGKAGHFHDGTRDQGPATSERGAEEGDQTRLVALQTPINDRLLSRHGGETHHSRWLQGQVQRELADYRGGTSEGGGTAISRPFAGVVQQPPDGGDAQQGTARRPTRRASTTAMVALQEPQVRYCPSPAAQSSILRPFRPRPGPKRPEAVWTGTFTPLPWLDEAVKWTLPNPRPPTWWGPK